MKIQRDIFRRGVRMTHAFDGLTKVRDPLGNQHFDMPWPMPPRSESSRAASGPLELKTHGEYTYRPHSSPVSKPGGGHASLQGPAPDLAQMLGMPEPVGTKRRLGPLKTDK